MSLMGGLGGALLPPVVMTIIADATGVKSGIGAVTKEMGAFETAMTKLAGVGKMAFAGLAIGAATVGVESVKLAANFDQTMELIHTQAGAAQSAVDALAPSVLAVAGQVGQSPGSLAEGLFHIASVLGPQVMNSVQGQAQAMDILTQSAKLASMGVANLDDVTYAMSGVMSAGMKDVSNATQGIAMMNAIVGSGDMHMEDLSKAIGTGVLPAFKSAGLGMSDFAAAVATITDNSTPADEAATRLRMTIALMAAPSGKAVDALKSIGIGATQLATDMTQPNGLLVAVQDLKSHLAGLSTVDANAIVEHAFGGGKTSGAIQTLLDETTTDAQGNTILKLQSKYDALGTSAQQAAAFQSGWADQQKQFSQQWHQLTSEVEAYGVKIGNWLIPHIEDTMHFMERHAGVVKVLAAVIGGILVAAMMAFTASVIANTVAMLADPATWIILAVIAAVALLVVGIYELVTHWTTVWNWIKKIAGDVADWFMRYVWHDGIEKFINWVKDIPHMVMDALRFLAHAFADPWIAAFNFVADAWNSTIGKLSWQVPSWVPGIGGSTISVPQLPHVSLSFDEGGIVPGPTGKAWPAIVHGGEGVLTADQMAALTRAANGGGWSGGGDIVIHNHTYLDGREIRTSVLRLQRGKGQSANTAYPQTTGMLPG